MRVLYIKSIVSYRYVRLTKFPNSAGIEYLRDLIPHLISVTIPAEVQLTPGIPEVWFVVVPVEDTTKLQQAVALVEETEVVFPISCQLRLTQQHWGEGGVEVEEQVVELVWASAGEIKIANVMAIREGAFFEIDRCICLFCKQITPDEKRLLWLHDARYWVIFIRFSMSDSLAYFKTKNKNLIRKMTRVYYKFTNVVSVTFFTLD